MNDKAERAGSPSNEAEAQLARVNAQVSAIRAVLVQLLQEVVVAEARLDHGKASLLLETNEQLIVSALGAQMEASRHEDEHLQHEQRHQDLREANEKLILAALGAQNLLDAAGAVRRRQAELLTMVADELSNPFAPIRLAASTLGVSGAQTTLLPRVQSVIDGQAERLARMVREVLDLQGRDRS